VVSRIREITAVTYVTLMSVTMFALSADPAMAATYKPPCNTYLSSSAGTVVNPIIGAFIGLRPVFFGLAVTAFLVGAVLAITEFGRSLVKWAMMVGGALLGFSAIISFGVALGLAKGC
jgi:hypothetical protein